MSILTRAKYQEAFRIESVQLQVIKKQLETDEKGCKIWVYILVHFDVQRDHLAQLAGANPREIPRLGQWWG